MEILIFLVIFAVLVGFWANAWGRSGLFWAVMAFIISPLAAGVILLVMGKSLEKKAAEHRAMRDLMND